MSKQAKTQARLSGRVRPELMSSYNVVRGAGYTDTEIINEGIRSLSRQVSACDIPQEQPLSEGETVVEKK